MHIETAKPDDAETILDIQKSAYQSEAEIYQDYSIPPLTQTLSQLVDDFSTSNFYIAKESGVIVGSVNVKVENNIAYIGRLIVSPTLQGQGIGSQLLYYAEKSHPEVARFELFTGHKSLHNLKLYTNRGYQESHRKVINQALTLIFLSKTNTQQP